VTVALSRQPGAFAPRWLHAAGVLVLLIAAAPFVPAFGITAYPPVLWHGVFALLLCLVGGLFLSAGARADFDARLRRGLRLMGAAFLVSGSTQLVLGLGWLGTGASTLSSVSTLSGYLLYLAGAFSLPTRPLSRHDRIRLTLDGAVTLLGGIIAVVMLVTLARANGATDADLSQMLLVPSVAQGLTLLALNFLAVCGEPTPTPRALGHVVVALLFLLVSQLVSQLLTVGSLTDPRWFDLAYALTLVLLLHAGAYYRFDPPGRIAPSRWLAVNPLPALIVLLIAGLLLLALRQQHYAAATVCALGLLPLLLLLIARVMVTNAERVQLLEEEARHERQRHTEKMDAIGRLAGGIAHQFNNLMTTIIGHAVLGEQEPGMGQQAREDFRQIREAGDRAATLTNQLLAYSGQQYMRLAPLDQSLTVAAVVREFGARLPRPVILETRLAAEPATITADREQVEIVVRQLLANACEAMPAGGRLLVRSETTRLSARLDSPILPVPPGEYGVISVEDSGAGIAASDLRRIFDPFFSTKPVHEGAGLGLAAVYGIVAAHGGGIVVESTPGAGTRMRIYLPLAVGR
jgi:signal transduction histidine kinase